MTSSIDSAKPAAGSASTSNVRANWLAAKNEMNELTRMSSDIVDVTGTADAIVATYTVAPVLAEGVRVSIVATATALTAAPTLNVNSTGAKVITAESGATMDVGAIVNNGYYDLIYDLGSDVWRCMNPSPVAIVQADVTDLVSDLALKAPLASPALTGNPTAPTATAGDNDTSVATTAYVDAASPSA